MSVGHPISKVDLDATCENIAIQLRNSFVEASKLNTFLLATSDTALEDLGYTPGEVANLKSGSGDIDLLRQIYEGTANLPSAVDFRRFIKFWVAYR